MICFNFVIISLQDLLTFLVSMKHCQFLSDGCFCRTCSLFFLPCFYLFEFLHLQFPHFSKTCHPVLLVIYYSAHWDLVKWPRRNWLSLGKLKKRDHFKVFYYKNCSSVREKLFLRSLFIQTVRTIFGNRMLF